ncbi:hypothetical protein APS_1353 [Acetobacter pasteurianus subsp. pasteurianus LMG 1262 = NBRC 106471]|nr:hypothetical protein APS_1353 [Acetobacter pasteurianus subsp. pasteurianus LMG 1262 = NBRC 106471]
MKAPYLQETKLAGMRLYKKCGVNRCDITVNRQRLFPDKVHLP